MSKVYLYYLCEIPNNVIRSQVIEYLAIQEKLGLKFELLFQISKGLYIKNFFELDKFRKEFNKKITSEITFQPIFSKTENFGVFSAFLGLYLYLKRNHRSKTIILHARGGFASSAAAKAKSHFENLRIIYDIRADGFAEFEYYARKNNMPEAEIQSSFKRYKKMEVETVKNTDHFFTVSDVLSERYKRIYNINHSKINTVPCVADENIFYFDKKLREEIRNKLKIGDRFTFVYAGGIGNYHYSDKVFEIIGGILKRFKEIYFIILTPDENAASNYAEKYLEKGSYFIKSAQRNEVKNFLMAADMGLLIREKHPLNEVAAPTKFAEYIMTGLPVMISEYIGDYSEFVRRKNLGIVLSNNVEPDEYLSKFESFKNDPTVPKREDIFKLGRENFSKQKYAKIMNKIYTNL